MKYEGETSRLLKIGLRSMNLYLVEEKMSYYDVLFTFLFGLDLYIFIAFYFSTQMRLQILIPIMIVLLKPSKEVPLNGKMSH